MARTALLLAAITALFLAVGYAIGGESGMVMAFGFALVTNAVSYWFSDSIVLKMYRAQPLTPESHPALAAMIARLARKAGIPVPRAYIIDSEQPNAFATGRNPKHGAVAVTTGILRLLNERELAGVIAHELAHIKNRDTLIMTVTATLAGAIGMLGNMAFFFGGHGRDGERRNPIIGLAVMILAPLAAMLVQMAISRTREYAADATGAHTSEDPLALASALEKISNAAHHLPNHAAEQNPATAHMFIINPLSGQRMDNFFSTHPNTENRVRALQELARARGQNDNDFRSSDDVMKEAPRITKRGSFPFG